MGAAPSSEKDTHARRSIEFLTDREMAQHAWQGTAKLWAYARAYALERRAVHGDDAEPSGSSHAA